MDIVNYHFKEKLSRGGCGDTTSTSYAPTKSKVCWLCPPAGRQSLASGRTIAGRGGNSAAAIAVRPRPTSEKLTAPRRYLIWLRAWASDTACVRPASFPSGKKTTYSFFLLTFTLLFVSGLPIHPNQIIIT